MFRLSGPPSRRELVGAVYRVFKCLVLLFSAYPTCENMQFVPGDSIIRGCLFLTKSSFLAISIPSSIPLELNMVDELENADFDSDYNIHDESDNLCESDNLDDSDNDELESQGESFSSLFLEILDEQEEFSVNKSQIQTVCEKILADANVVRGRVGVVLTDNETIHELNQNFLSHDYPTDVISFQVESDADSGLLEGEVIVSVEMANQRGPKFGWGREEETVLYVIHGLLHLIGYDDIEEEDRVIMREKESEYLRFIGIEPTNLGFDVESEDFDDADFPDSERICQTTAENLDSSEKIEDLGAKTDEKAGFTSSTFNKLIDDKAERN
ncbi:MAG: rRNA maturation RNase YbeY [Thermoguttaceae bacterium]